MLDHKTGTDQDAADTATDSSDEGENGVGATAKIDWESDDNPYKKRFGGEQSRSAKLVTERDTALSALSNFEGLSSRFDDLEDMVADISDRGDTRASTSTLDSFDDDLEDGPPAGSTGKARARVQESRQAAVMRERDVQANKVYARLNQGWVEGMDAQSPEMVEVSRLYNEALQDPAKRGQLNTALTLFDSYKRSVTSAAAASPPPPTPKGEGDGAKGDEGADDSDEDDTLLEDDPNKTPTARQRNRDAGAGQGQEGAGSAVPRDTSNLTPEDKFALHAEGKTPANY